MSKTIFLCSSMAFYKELVDIEKQLETKGLTVKIPVSAQLIFFISSQLKNFW